MCGICGYAAFGGGAAYDAAVRATRRMQDALAHRGPDDAGEHADQASGIVLAQRRLSVIDTSSAGRQPLFNEDRSIAAVINGEIYNFRELRSGLEARGHRFSSHTDVEAVIHLYEEDPDGFSGALRGMFAYAIADFRRQRLVLGRDPLGIKPLYVCRHRAGTAFASEIGAFARLDPPPTGLDPDGIADYLLLGSIPAPRTHLRGVRALEAGDQLVIDGAGETSRRFDLVRELALGAVGAGPDDTLAATVRDSVARHLVSDVPIGVFLSGGIDSGAIAGLARAAGAGPVRTLAVTLPGDPLDEARYARATADRFGTEHVEIPLGQDTFEDEISLFFRHLDQPSIDGLNSFVVSRAARQAGLTVALSGLGGDEFFGGYPTFSFAPRLARLMRLAGPGRGLAARALARATRGSGAARVAEVLRTCPPDLRSGYLAYRGLFVGRHMADLLVPARRGLAAGALDRFLAETAWVPEARLPAPLAVGALEASRYMRAQLLRDTDVMSMAHSLEVRVPLVDREVARAALAGLAHAVRGDGHPKPGLRAALSTPLPAEVVARRKQGFVFPWQSWLRGKVRTDFDRRLLLPGPWEEFLDRGALGALRDEYLGGRAHWSTFWAVYVLLRLTGTGFDDAGFGE